MQNYAGNTRSLLFQWFSPLLPVISHIWLPLASQPGGSHAIIHTTDNTVMEGIYEVYIYEG